MSLNSIEPGKTQGGTKKIPCVLFTPWQPRCYETSCAKRAFSSRSSTPRRRQQRGSGILLGLCVGRCHLRSVLLAEIMARTDPEISSLIPRSSTPSWQRNAPARANPSEPGRLPTHLKILPQQFHRLRAGEAEAEESVHGALLNLRAGFPARN